MYLEVPRHIHTSTTNSVNHHHHHRHRQKAQRTRFRTPPQRGTGECGLRHIRRPDDPHLKVEDVQDLYMYVQVEAPRPNVMV